MSSARRETFEHGSDIGVRGFGETLEEAFEQTKIQTRRFARQLEGRFNIPCHLVDERLSSREARDLHKTRREAAGQRPDDRAAVDALAAQLIVETWLADNAILK